MYIGELCRYLVNSPPHPQERAHRLRLCCGNGLRSDVWGEFQSRFAIPTIVEFYAATEGNVALFNLEGKTGAVGRIPWFLAGNFPTKLVRFDVERHQHIRDARGLCVEAAPGEIGEAVGRIFHDPSKPAGRFEGYSNAQENEAKILRDVFETGDAWFRTGDLMRRDVDGYYYFIDRIGDTYRWKGENVSTTAVAEIMCAFPGIREANVYGVEVPGREGRAGMAAIVCDADVDLVALRAQLAAHLPDYARPMFLRVRDEIDVTATFKQRKVGLVKDGFDPTGIPDAIYFDDPRKGAYMRLDEALYRDIGAGVAVRRRCAGLLARAWARAMVRQGPRRRCRNPREIRRPSSRRRQRNAARLGRRGRRVRGTSRRHHPPVRALPPSQRGARSRHHAGGAGVSRQRRICRMSMLCEHALTHP
jgi:fatty-acyl-CoA synthase